MPKREERLNPMPRRRPKAEPPGQEWMVLGAEATCPECGWTSLSTNEDEASEMLANHPCKVNEGGTP